MRTGMRAASAKRTPNSADPEAEPSRKPPPWRYTRDARGSFGWHTTQGTPPTVSAVTSTVGVEVGVARGIEARRSRRSAGVGTLDARRGGTPHEAGSPLRATSLTLGRKGAGNVGRTGRRSDGSRGDSDRSDRGRRGVASVLLLDRRPAGGIDLPDAGPDRFERRRQAGDVRHLRARSDDQGDPPVAQSLCVP